MEWYNRIVKAAEPPRDIKQLFAFYHFFWSKQKDYDEVVRRLENQRKYTFDKEMFANEVSREAKLLLNLNSQFSVKFR